MGIVILLLVIAVSAVTAQEGGRAAIVVRSGDDAVESRCVAFEESEISGYELLERSGLLAESKVVGMGALVCRLGETGCPAGDCFCECKGGDECVYWSYWRLAEAGWQYSQIGATQRTVSDGDVEGWSWGPGSVTGAIEPPVVSFEELCSAQENVTDGNDNFSAIDTEAWPTYLAFGLIIVFIGGVIIVVRRRRPGQ
jgi:hypothetical protein